MWGKLKLHSSAAFRFRAEFQAPHNMTTFSPTVCLFNFVIEYRSGWTPMQLEFRFTALLWPVSGTKHTCTHAYMHTDTVLQTQVLKKPANSRITVFCPFLFQLSWVYALWQRFFDYNRLHWPLPHSGPEICEAQLMSSYWILDFFSSSSSGSHSAQAKSPSKGNIIC